MSRFTQAGFSLMELMVGLTIGMISTVVIIQVMSFFEGQRRTTTGSADAQTNGGIALYSIGREMQIAGYPLQPVTDSALECTVLNVNAGATGITGITPISIADGVASSGVNASDTITIRYGTTQTGGAVTQISAVAGTVMTVGSNLGCLANDVTLVSSGAVCNLSKASAVSAAGTSPITVTLQDATGAGSGANIACMGAWNEVSYSVNSSALTLDRAARVNGTNTSTPMLEGIVNIQAQYGISSGPTSNQITAWVDPSGATWAAPTVTNRNRIKAIRVAVIARNSKIESTAVTTACSSTTAATPTGLCAWAGSAGSPAPTVDLSTADANWARYRYRVFETIIPLRNVIWSKDTL